MSKPDLKGMLETFNVQHSTYNNGIKSICWKLKVGSSMLNVFLVLTFTAWSALFPIPPVMAAPPQAAQRIEIKSRDIRGSDMTKERCLQLIYSTSLTKDLRGAKLDDVDISGANLISADLSEASLKKSILKGTKLIRANLTKANLENAILYQADLNNAKLNNTNLKSANLMKANLKNALLVGADLAKAILIDADLSGANLTGANLDGANLDGANLTGTIMADGQVHP